MLAALILTLIAGLAETRPNSGNLLIELIDIAAQQLVVAEPAATLKWIDHGDIELRIQITVQQILTKMRAEASTKPLTQSTSHGSSGTRSTLRRPSNTAGRGLRNSIRPVHQPHHRSLWRRGR